MELVHLCSKQHLRPLDGLRGLAILGVLSCHFVRVAPGEIEPISNFLGKIAGFGWLGVDLFFVLSGFLITGILLDSKGTPHYLRNFYARRTIRIFPLYYVYLLGILGMVWVHHMIGREDPQFSRLLHDCAWAIPYLTNIQIAITNTKISTFLNHFWSLAIEEQFYLIWPALIRFVAMRKLAVTCCVVTLMAFCMRLACLTLGYTQAAQTLMPCRADSLAIGSLLAIGCRNEQFLTWMRGIKAWILLLFALPVIGCSTAGGEMVEAFFPTAVAMAFGALLLFSISPAKPSWIGDFFSSSILRSFGKYSYGLYVFNQAIAFFPGNVLFHDRLVLMLGSSLIATVVHAVAGIAVTFVIAWSSWHLLEKHFLKFKGRFV